MRDAEQVPAERDPMRTTGSRFSAASRSMAEEDEIALTSVGVDIGSTTSHMVFSRLELARRGTRYVVTKRAVLYQSRILLTPYLGRDGAWIDQEALGRFVGREYEAAGIERDSIDSGVLILTGVALRRRNARAIAELFAKEAGRFVAVSAGDNFEATLAAHGSGAVLLSEVDGSVMNIDIGGGTTKVAICREGRVNDLMTMDIGARLVAYDQRGVVTRIEEAGHEIARRLGIELALGRVVGTDDLQAMASYMVDELVREVRDGERAECSLLLRTPPLQDRSGVSALTFSGGVAEFIYGRTDQAPGDLGVILAAEIERRGADLRAPIRESAAGIRGTVIGASQYTVQVSGNTIYVNPPDVVPARNVLVVRPSIPWGDSVLNAEEVRAAIASALRRFDQDRGDAPVAIAIRWAGSATYDRIKALCSGVAVAMRAHVERGHPLVLACDRDIGGLLGLHIHDVMGATTPVISVDGLHVGEFDYIDIGALIPGSGAVPVVIKSLAFSREAEGDARR